MQIWAWLNKLLPGAYPLTPPKMIMLKMTNIRHFLLCYNSCMGKIDCLFCNYSDTESHKIIIENDLAYSRWDNFPVSEGHAEVVPKRHIESFFDLTDKELLAIYDLVKQVKEIVDTKFSPDAYNIGVNDGQAAGRTINHCHVHLIPRYMGDVDEPRGGVRHIIPGKGSY